MVMKNIENTILEKNIYGVDLNEESVEIAKLSLWLRTAQPRRKLNTLNNNIKCGNSLIDDPKVAGDKAFNWKDEFPQIFTEKKKKAWHITTATHNSRYSQRMFDNNVKTGEAIWLAEKDEIIITKIVAEIVKQDNLNVIEYNICGDHMHLLLVCEKEELTKIVGKLKAVSGRKYNIEKGITIPVTATSITRGLVPLSDSELDIVGSKKDNPLSDTEEKNEIEKIKKEFLCSKEHAFRTEYNGGFDGVIGNPPYVTNKLGKNSKSTLDEDMNFYKMEYGNLVEYKGNLYSLFIGRINGLLKDNACFSFIIPNSIMFNLTFKNIRNFIRENFQIKEFVNLKYEPFEDANTGGCLIFNFNKEKESCPTKVVEVETEEAFLNEKFRIKEIDYRNDIEITQGKFLTNIDGIEIVKKCYNNSIPLGDIVSFYQGIITGDNKRYISNKKINDRYKPILRGGDIFKV